MTKPKSKKQSPGKVQQANKPAPKLEFWFDQKPKVKDTKKGE